MTAALCLAGVVAVVTAAAQPSLPHPIVFVEQTPLVYQMAGQLNPLVGADGMVYFSQWDFHDRRTSILQNNSDFDVNRFLLWKVFADGSGLDHPHFGAHTVYDFAGGYLEARELPRRRGHFVAVLADELFTFGGGALVRLEPQSNQDLDQPIFLTPDVFMTAAENTAGRWRSPYALDVTLRGRNGDAVENGDFQRRILPGQAATVRFYRENVRTANLYDEFPGHADPDLVVLGTAPVAADGSFAAVVPADTPIQWEVLDAGGQVLVRERFGTELKAGELRRCGGCHAPHDGRGGATTNLALQDPTNLSGRDVDLDRDGVVDLISFVEGGVIFSDGFESGALDAWTF